MGVDLVHVYDSSNRLRPACSKETNPRSSVTTVIPPAIANAARYASIQIPGAAVVLPASCRQIGNSSAGSSWYVTNGEAIKRSSRLSASSFVLAGSPYCRARAGVESKRRRLCCVARQNAAGRPVLARASASDAASCAGCELNESAIQTLLSMSEAASFRFYPV